jgi:hypothetical protein
MKKGSLKDDPDMDRLEEIFRKLPPERQKKFINELERGELMEKEQHHGETIKEDS